MNETRREKGNGVKNYSKIKHLSADVHFVTATGAQTTLSRINSLVFINELHSLATQKKERSENYDYS